MKDTAIHKKRITAELKAVGMTAYGLMKTETERLPKIIHQNEHIGGVAYGHTTGDKIGSAMLIATDNRIIFLDVKPFFTTMDEIAYRVVSGVKLNKAGPFAGVVLHTKIRDYGLRFVNTKCAKVFVKFIETYIELHSKIAENDKDIDDRELLNPAQNIDEQPKILVESEYEKFIHSQSTAVLSTVTREGNVRGSVVHYVFKNGVFHFVTKTDTSKSKNIAAHGQVAITIHPADSLKTAQISGYAEIEDDQDIAASAYQTISTPKIYTEGHHFPPIISMKKGDVIVFKIVPTSIEYQDFSLGNW